MKRLINFRVLGLVFVLATGAAASATPVARLTGDTMGTQYHASVVAPAMDETALRAGLEARLEEVNVAMSTWRQDSELSRLNAHDGTDWMPVSPGLHVVLKAAARVGAETGGAFDVTVGPLVDLWGFGPARRASTPPSDAAIAAARTRVGYRLLELGDAPPRLRRRRGDVEIDLSAIAKGYAVDQLAAWLTATGHRDFIVEVGGEIRARGRRPDGRPWQVGVAWPVGGTDAVERVVALDDTGLATSGDYRQYFEHAGRRYSHEIDPVTGRPIVHRLASVTVLHPSCMMADAYATGLLVLGPERGPTLARRLGLNALFLVRRAQGFEGIVTGDFPSPPH